MCDKNTGKNTIGKVTHHRELWQQEVSALLKLAGQRHTVKMVDCFASFLHDVYVIELENYAGGQVPTSKFFPSGQCLKNWLVQLFEALEHCHKSQLLHLDVKPQNLLCYKNEQTNQFDLVTARF
jgi:serine/threonine protein kinase